MGKKKDKARRKHAGRHGDRHAEMRLDIPPHVAGIAAAALKQVDTPAFRQMIAGALGAAAQAFDRRRQAPAAAAAAPASPAPVAPAPASPTGSAAEPRFATADLRLPPEAERALDHAAAEVTRAVGSAATLAARAIEDAAAAMERWAQRAASDRHDGRPSSEPAD